ncbi:MAG: DUF983 domain-containing protein [Azospirillaceae bacterium]|nr:DUF983 domain-containing protein [Azospirillaceae bacterium]
MSPNPPSALPAVPLRASTARALWRGWRGRCPRCGVGRLLTGYLTVAEQCSQCRLALAEYRSDDAPPYFTILLVGHIIVPCILILEQNAHPAVWVHMALWLPLTLLLTFFLLPRVKGAVLGTLWALRIKP